MSRAIEMTVGCSLVLAFWSCTSLPTPVPAPPRDCASLPAVPISAAPEAPAPTARAQGSDPWRGGVRGMLGYREVDDDFDPVEQQLVLGVEADMRPASFPLGMELGLLYSIGFKDDFEGTGVDVTAGIGELYLGPRLTFDLADDTIHPYLGGGVTLMLADLEFSTSVGGGTAAISDDTAVAGYAHAGVLFDVGESLDIGLDVRGTFGSEFDFELAGARGTLDGDYLQFAVVFGTHW